MYICTYTIPTLGAEVPMISAPMVMKTPSSTMAQQSEGKKHWQAFTLEWDGLEHKKEAEKEWFTDVHCAILVPEFLAIFWPDSLKVRLYLKNR